MQGKNTSSDPTLAGRFPAGTIIGSVEYNKIASANSMIDFFARKDPSCVDRYFKTPYVNHDTRARDGELEPVYELAHKAVNWDQGHAIVRRTLGEGDLVVCHILYSNLMNIVGQRVAFDIFRLHDGKIVEHWDGLEYAGGEDSSGLGQIAGSVDIVDRGHEEANRAVVTRFAETVLRDGKTDQTDRFIDTARFVAHSQQRTPGLTRRLGSFVGAADAPKVTYLGFHIVIAEGNFVFLQGEGRVGDEQVLVVLDLFRLHEGKIVEHWDVLEPLAPKEKWNNPHGPFLTKR